MPRKKFKCSKCSRSFSMAAHLARHKSTIHASPAAKAKRKAKKRGVGRPKGSGIKRSGRPSGFVSRLGLRQMSVEQLCDVIDAAREAARGKINDLRQAFA